MAMDKIGNINLETSANYQNLSNLNVQFWNQDKETAVLQFKITRNDFPLSLSKENVEVFIKLESGANYIVDNTEVTDGGFEIIDELNGIVSYTIPTEFMTVAQSVTGQVYVATKDREEVVVQRKFSFEVAEDLLSTIPASEKLKEIKLFAQLRDEASDTMAELNEDFANMQDYVTMVNQAATDGVKQINTLSDDKLTEYNSNHNVKLNEITTTGDNYTTQFVDDKNYVDEKISEFEQKVMDSDVVTQGEAGDWQKYKLTDDDGSRQYINKGTITDITTLEPGYYETVSNDDPTTQNFPPGFTGAAYTQIDVTIGGSNRKQIEVVHSYQGKVWRRYIHTDGTRDSGWLEIPLVNDASELENKDGAQAKANTAESNAKVYTNKVVSETNEVIFMGSAKNIGSTITLSKPYTDYDELKIFVYGHGAAETYIRDTDPNRKIVMYSFNITDSDASNGDIVETHIEKNSPTNLEITHAGSYNFPTNSGNTESILGVEVYKIVGVRYHENLNQS